MTILSKKKGGVGKNDDGGGEHAVAQPHVHLHPIPQLQVSPTMSNERRIRI